MHVTEILELRAVCGLDALTYTAFLGVYSVCVHWWHGRLMSWMVAITHGATALVAILVALFLTSATVALPMPVLPLVLLLLTPTVLVKTGLLLRARQRRVRRDQEIQVRPPDRAEPVPAGPLPPAAASADAGSGPAGPAR